MGIPSRRRRTRWRRPSGVREQEELPPEPRRYGFSGAWYEVPLTCPSCETLLGQGFDAQDGDIMRRYFDHMILERNLREGQIVYQTRGLALTVEVHRDGRSLRVIQYIPTTEGMRSTDDYGYILDLEVGPGDELLFGRKYRIQATTDDAFEATDEGYRAKRSFVEADRVWAILDLAPVRALDASNPHFQFDENARITFTGRVGYVRSDYDGAALATHQQELEAAAQAEEQRLARQQEALTEGHRAYDANDLELAVQRYTDAIELGLAEDGELRFNLGAAYQQLRRYDEAPSSTAGSSTRTRATPTCASTSPGCWSASAATPRRWRSTGWWCASLLRTARPRIASVVWRTGSLSSAGRPRG